MLHDPTGVTPISAPPKLDPGADGLIAQLQVNVNAGQEPYMPPNPYMLQMGTPPSLALSEAKVVELLANTLGKFKEKILSVVRPQIWEVFTVRSQERTSMTT